MSRVHVYIVQCTRDLSYSSAVNPTINTEIEIQKHIISGFPVTQLRVKPHDERFFQNCNLLIFLVSSHQDTKYYNMVCFTCLVFLVTRQLLNLLLIQ